MAGVSKRAGEGMDHGRGAEVRWVSTAILFLLLVLWSSAAFGYVLTGPHILALMTAKLAGPQTLTVHQHLTIEDPLISDQPIGMSEELNYLFPDQFRSEIWHEETHRISVTSRGEALTIVDDRVTTSTEGRFDRYKDLLLYRSKKLLHKALLRHGVDVGITSLGRMEDRVVFVIGAQYPDDSVSQVWVDKELLLPLRWLSVLPQEGMSGQSDRLEIIYAKWQQLDGVWYPMYIESLYNGRRLRSMEVRRVEANAVIAGELLNISHMISVYASPEASETTEGPSSSDVDEVERTLEEFRKKFEP